MLEPRMVAVSTQEPDFSGQRTPGVLPRITASSHGCLILNVDAYGLRMDSAPLDSRSHGNEGTVILSPMRIFQPFLESMWRQYFVTRTGHLRTGLNGKTRVKCGSHDGVAR